MTEREIYFKQLQLGPMQNFIYLIGDPTSREAAIIDPGWEVPKILEELRKDDYQPTRVFLTHTHPDHMMGLGALLKAVDIPVHVHHDEADQLKIEQSSLSPVDGGQIIPVGSLPVQLIHTPGHTPGSQCLLVNGRLLSGDTLFIKGCGRCDLPGGDAAQLYDSLTKLGKLEDKTLLFPGHDYAPVPHIELGEEKRSSPFLKQPNLEAFLRMLGHG